MEAAVAQALARLDDADNGAAPSGFNSGQGSEADGTPGPSRRPLEPTGGIGGYDRQEVHVRKRRKSELADKLADSDAEESDSGGEHGAFAAGGKATAFSRAIAGILDGADGMPSASGGPILMASKSLLKRKRQEAEEEKGNREARKQRQDMRSRGYVPVLAKGEDPQQDAHEKALMKLATRGVVRLFNAVSKAQSADKEAGPKRTAKDAAATKRALLAELHGRAARSGAEAGRSAAAAGGIELTAPSRTAEDGGWAVLRDGFAGLVQGSGTKLKDWDKVQDSSEGDELLDDASDDASESQ